MKRVSTQKMQGSHKPEKEEFSKKAGHAKKLRRTVAGLAFLKASAFCQNFRMLFPSACSDLTLYFFESSSFILIQGFAFSSLEKPAFLLSPSHWTGVRALSLALSCSPARTSLMSGLSVPCFADRSAYTSSQYVLVAMSGYSSIPQLFGTLPIPNSWP